MVLILSGSGRQVKAITLKMDYFHFKIHKWHFGFEVCIVDLLDSSLTKEKENVVEISLFLQCFQFLTRFVLLAGCWSGPLALRRDRGRLSREEPCIAAGPTDRTPAVRSPSIQMVNRVKQECIPVGCVPAVH